MWTEIQRILDTTVIELLCSHFVETAQRCGRYVLYEIAVEASRMALIAVSAKYRNMPKFRLQYLIYHIFKQDFSVSGGLF